MSSTMLSQAISSNGFSSTFGMLAGNAKAKETERKFSSLVDGISAGLDTSRDASFSSSEIKSDPRLPGDFISSLAVTDATPYNRAAAPEGAAANSGFKGTIDKTSRLYEQARELESYFVKIMLSSMRNTVEKSSLTGKEDFAGNMYEDMLYDEMSRNVTKNAGFGLADQVYLQLTGQK